MSEDWKVLINGWANQIPMAKRFFVTASILRAIGQPEESSQLYSQAKESFEKVGDQSGIAKTLGQLGRLAEEQGDLELAERLYKEAHQIFERLGANPYLKLAKRDVQRVRRKASSHGEPA